MAEILIQAMIIVPLGIIGGIKSAQFCYWLGYKFAERLSDD